MQRCVFVYLINSEFSTLHSQIRTSADSIVHVSIHDCIVPYQIWMSTLSLMTGKWRAALLGEKAWGGAKRRLRCSPNSSIIMDWRSGSEELAPTPAPAPAVTLREEMVALKHTHTQPRLLVTVTPIILQSVTSVEGSLRLITNVITAVTRMRVRRRMGVTLKECVLPLSVPLAWAGVRRSC